MVLPRSVRFEAAVKQQYVRDISDYRKYALLRALAAEGANRIGVCWMLTPSDGSTDGNKLVYLSQPEKHRTYNPALFDTLAHAAAEPDRRRLNTIEESGAIPSARYFNEPLSDDTIERQTYMDACLAAFAETDLVFFDPDNGLEVPSLRIGRKNSSKYVYLDEISAFFKAGKSVLIYQHFPRVEREAFVSACVERLRAVTPDAALWAFRTKPVVFLLVVQPGAKATLVEAAKTAASRWDPCFLVGTEVADSRIAPALAIDIAREGDELKPEAEDQTASTDQTDTSSPDLNPPSLLRRLLHRLV